MYHLHHYRVSLILMFFFLSCGQPSQTDPADSRQPAAGQRIALWAESIYLRGFNPTTKVPLTTARLLEYCQLLKKNHVTELYLFAGPFGSDGHLPSYPFSDTAFTSIEVIRRELPNIRILPWVGGIQNKTVYLDDSNWVKTALSDAVRLVNFLQVDGIHADFEYILPSDTGLSRGLRPDGPAGQQRYAGNVTAFHRRLRSLLPHAFLSSVVVATCPETRPWKRKTSVAELDDMLPFIDQLCFLYYDTNIRNADTFQLGCDHLVDDIRALKRRHDNVEYYIAIGTFVNDPSLQHYRDLDIETIPKSIATIQKSLRRFPAAQPLVSGLAVFCDWATDDNEWEQIRTNWLRR